MSHRYYYFTSLAITPSAITPLATRPLAKYSIWALISYVHKRFCADPEEISGFRALHIGRISAPAAALREGLILVASLPARVQAGPTGTPLNASTTLAVSATVVIGCVITTTPISFGNVDAVMLGAGVTYRAQGAVNIQCGGGYAAATGMIFSGGRNQAAAQALGVVDTAGNQAARAMSNGTSSLAYTMYQDSAATTAILPNVAVSNLPVRMLSANGQTPYIYNVYGMIPGGRRRSAGPRGSRRGTTRI